MEVLYAVLALLVLLIIVFLIHHLVSSGDTRYYIFLVILLPAFAWLCWQAYDAGEERRRLTTAQKIHIVPGTVLEQSGIDTSVEGALPPLPPLPRGYEGGREEESLTIGEAPEELREIQRNIRLAK